MGKKSKKNKQKKSKPLCQQTLNMDLSNFLPGHLVQIHGILCSIK